MSTHTVFSDDAHRCATSDRKATADLVLATAVAEAEQLVREGKPGHAEYVLSRAGLRAERILGDRPGVSS